MFPENELTPTLFAINLDHQDHPKDIKTPLDTWSLLKTDDILLEIVTNTNKYIEAFVNEHVDFDKMIR